MQEAERDCDSKTCVKKKKNARKTGASAGSRVLLLQNTLRHTTSTTGLLYADTSRTLVQGAEYPSSYYYDISRKLVLKTDVSSKVIIAVNWCRRRSIPRATTTTLVVN